MIWAKMPGQIAFVSSSASWMLRLPKPNKQQYHTACQKLDMCGSLAINNNMRLPKFNCMHRIISCQWWTIAFHTRRSMPHA
jgi:hypothetical protein